MKKKIIIKIIEYFIGKNYNYDSVINIDLSSSKLAFLRTKKIINMYHTKCIGVIMADKY